MKNILLAGPSRSGKSTLARKIHEELGHFVISLDQLVAIFDGAYPELDIRLNWNREKTTNHIAPFLSHFLGTFGSCDGFTQGLNLHAHAIKGNRFLLEGGYFNFEQIVPILKAYQMETLNQHFILIGLVQNQKTAEDFFVDFRKYDTEDDWTYPLSDEDLRDISRDAVAFSQQMTAHLTDYGFTLYDTSFERERVFERILKEIKEKMS